MLPLLGLGSALALMVAGPAGWPVRHADPTNSDHVEGLAPDHLEPAWFHGPDVPIGTFVAIDGELLLTHSYNTDTKPDGAYRGCHLWALDAKTGAVRWCSGKVGAALTSLAVDGRGGIFVADTKRLFRFDRTGKLVWRRSIPSETSALTWSLDGGLLVADYAGNVRIYDPATGRLRTRPFTLPAAPYPRGPITPAEAPGQLEAGVGADYLPRLIDNFFGYGIVIKDVPAVVPQSGRIFIAGNSRDGRTGSLYGLDLDQRSRLRIACETEIGANSDTSPAISADGTSLYIAAAGELFAIDTASCKIRWRLRRDGVAAASPLVFPDGRIVLMAGGNVSAFQDRGTTGELLWQRTGDEIAAAEGFAQGVFDSVAIGAASRRVYVTATYGPRLEGIPFPQAHRLIVLDAANGRLVSTAPLGAESDSTPSISHDGWVYVPTKSLAHAHWISERKLGRLPEQFRQLPLPRPRNGVYAFRPVWKESR
nr:PQQ-binding-like beta-propeller repeat protein [Erythrobacter tepidarius]